MADNTTNSITPEEALAQLRALRAQIPNYTQVPAYPAAILRAVAVVDPQFVDATTGAIGASQQLQDLVGATPEQCVAEAGEASRWAQVEDELEATLKGVRNANLGRKHRIGVRALQTYQVTKQLVRMNEHADLQPHLAEMRKHNRFGKGRRNAAQQPAPVPVAQNDVQ
jgi:ABC-type uncharacterized transport system permease subunit